MLSDLDQPEVKMRSNFIQIGQKFLIAFFHDYMHIKKMNNYTASDRVKSLVMYYGNYLLWEFALLNKRIA